MTPVLRRGIEVRLNGSPINVTRNRRKLRLRNREIRIASKDGQVEWVARGGSSAGKTEIVDLKKTETVWQSDGLDSSIICPISPPETLLIVALVLNDIPQSMSLKFARL